MFHDLLVHLLELIQLNLIEVSLVILDKYAREQIYCRREDRPRSCFIKVCESRMEVPP